MSKIMSNLVKIALVSALALSSIGANAEFIKGDWKTVGDNLSVVDIESGVEWLSLGQTDSMSINQVQGLLETTFQGWRLPTQSEVNTMIHNLTGLDTEDNGFNTFSVAYRTEALSNYYTTGATGSYYYWRYAQGMYMGDDGDVLMSGSTHNNYAHENNGTIHDDNLVSSDLNYKNVYYGVYLVSDGGMTLASIDNPSINSNNANVPVPASLGLLGLAMAGLSFRRKK
jgi:hypothetical protein